MSFWDEFQKDVTFGFYDPAKNRSDAQDAANNAASNAQADSATRNKALDSGLAAGEERASKYYNPSDSARRLKDSRQFSEDQANKGMFADEYSAEKGNIQSAYNRSYANLGNKLGAAGIKGGAAVRAKSELARNENQSERDLALSSAALKRQGNSDRETGAQEDISRSESMRLAEGGLKLNSTAGSQLANDAAQPTRSSMTQACVVLVALGLMSPELHAKESIALKKIDPSIIETYNQKLAPLIIESMNRSKTVEKYVAVIAVSWAQEITKDKPNLLGKFVNFFGQNFIKLIRGNYVRA